MLYGFELGREFKLSIAEILSVFPNAKPMYSASGALILDNLEKEDVLKKANSLGGTIKIFELSLFVSEKAILENLLELGKTLNGKFKYSLNIFGDTKDKLQDYLKKSKRLLKQNSVSARYFNKDNGANLSSAQILGNSILKKGFDLNIVSLGDIFYFGKTIWVQDIDAYSKRDYSKSRDMQIGMLPPKLAQMMINLSLSSKISDLSSIYDPFVGLGTVLIEAKRMGFERLYGSDLNEKMVETALKNVSGAKIEKLNAKFVNEVSFWDEVKNGIIVTEGYLGEIMTKKNISLDRIAKQRDSLIKIYEGFFFSLKKGGFSGNIVVCFPFWECPLSNSLPRGERIKRGKYIFFTEILNILNKYCDILPLLPKEFNFQETKSGSLLYKRPKQLVGREIFKLKIK